jgi:hypothetical protein
MWPKVHYTQKGITTATCRLSAIFIFLLLCLGGRGVSGAERDGRWAILVVGASGEPGLQETYLKEIRDLRSILEDSLGFHRDQIVVLADDPTKSPDLIQDKSTRENLQAVCFQLAHRVDEEDLVFVFIEGHGSYDGKIYKLNLVGPDPTALELATMLYSIRAKRFVVVNATNCSGGSLPEFSQKGKIVITSTKSGMEKNQTHMGRYFVEALKNNGADSDKNGRVSMIEAFLYMRRKVEEYYSNEGKLQTEHPILDDNGDAQGQSEPSPENGEGLLARTTFLDAGTSVAENESWTPEQRKLALEAQELEEQIEALKYNKSSMAEADYEKKLEDLLLRLARINEKLPK